MGRECLFGAQSEWGKWVEGEVGLQSFGSERSRLVSLVKEWGGEGVGQAVVWDQNPQSPRK